MDTNRLNEIRQKEILGTATEDELREALKALRAGRMSASIARTSAKASSEKPVIDGNALLDELLP